MARRCIALLTCRVGTTEAAERAVAAPKGPHRGWFRVPHRIHENIAVLKSSGLAVYCALSHFANREGRAWPSIRTLASTAGVRPATVRAALNRLQKCGFILIVQRRNDAGDYDSYLFTLLDHTGTKPGGVGQTGPYRGQIGALRGGSNGDPEQESGLNKKKGTRREDALSSSQRDAQAPEPLGEILSRLTSEVARRPRCFS